MYLSCLSFFVLMSLMIVISLIFIGTMFSSGISSNEDSESPFECGFEPLSFSRVPFSMQIFSITIVFLIFDLEVVILLPLIMSSSKGFSVLWFSLVILIILLGLLIEWYDGSLDWSL